MALIWRQAIGKIAAKRVVTYAKLTFRTSSYLRFQYKSNLKRSLAQSCIDLNMSKDRNIVHRYFKKSFEEATLLVKVNPILFKGVEISLLGNGKVEMRELSFDEGIWEDLETDGFVESSALEFNLYYSGLAQ